MWYSEKMCIAKVYTELHEQYKRISILVHRSVYYNRTETEQQL